MFSPNIPEPLLYGLLFLAGLLENLIPPLPGDSVMVFGAFLASQGVLTFYIAYFCATVGSITGYMLLFILAKHFGPAIIVRLRWINNDSLVQGEAFVRRYGYPVILINRFLPGFRSVISIVSGFCYFSTPLVLLLATCSALLWNFIWMQFAFTMGGNWEQVQHKFSEILATYNRGVLTAIILIVVVGAALLLYKYKRKHKLQK